MVRTKKEPLKVLRTDKILSRREVFEIHFAEYHTLVAPCSHIFLPLRYDMVGIRRVSVGLRIGIYGASDMIMAKILQTLPPIINTMIAFCKIILASYHRI